MSTFLTPVGSLMSGLKATVNPSVSMKKSLPSLGPVSLCLVGPWKPTKIAKLDRPIAILNCCRELRVLYCALESRFSGWFCKIATVK